MPSMPIQDQLSERAQRLHYLTREISRYLLRAESRHPDYGSLIRYFCNLLHQANREAGWWNDLQTGQPLNGNMGELLMLTISEVIEAKGGIDGDLMDDKLPHRKMFEVELADVLIRCGDWISGKSIDAAAEFEAAADATRIRVTAIDFSFSVDRELMDLVTAISNVMEADRKGRPLNRLAADVLARVFFIGVQCNLDLAGAVAEKFDFNKSRPDHRRENRLAQDGKTY